MQERCCSCCKSAEAPCTWQRHQAAARPDGQGGQGVYLLFLTAGPVTLSKAAVRTQLRTDFPWDPRARCSEDLLLQGQVFQANNKPSLQRLYWQVREQPGPGPGTTRASREGLVVNRP